MPPPPQAKPPKWADVKDHVVLYHGTASVFKDALLAGIDPIRGGRDRDFGQGFYTTTFEPQAKEWASKIALKLRTAPKQDLLMNSSWRHAEGCVIWFRVPLAKLAILRSLVFVRPNPDNELLWSFVSHCRLFPSGRLPRNRNPADFTHLYDHPNGGGMYDMVSGPVAAEWAGKKPKHFRRRVYEGYDQFSFHTADAVAIFNELLQNGEQGRDYGHTTYSLIIP